MQQLASFLSEMTLQAPAQRGECHGAFHAAWSDAEVAGTKHPARPVKKRGGCKTCDGRGCVGHCRF
jgi:hypothetical protein